jgi:hypothetical protein
MTSHAIDSIVESLVTGQLEVDEFMQAIQANIEDLEAQAQEP